MSLREEAEKDLGLIVEDDQTGFGWPIEVIDPEGKKVSGLTGLSDDISQLIDPETGAAVSGRLASVAIRIAALTTAGLGLPRAIADENSKPWRVNFDDINGSPHTFKVAQSNPDRAIGLVVCILELYAA